jgi:hypothetical protein
LPALAVGLLGIVPTFAASADEDAVAKSVEAFRVAQIVADAKAFDALCAAELSYSHSDGRVEDKGNLYRQRHQRKIEVSIAGIPGHGNSCGRHRRDHTVMMTAYVAAVSMHTQSRSVLVFARLLSGSRTS